MNELFCGGSGIFMFLFPSILFHSTGDELSAEVSELELDMMQNLERYLLHHFKGDIVKASIWLGNIVEMIQLFHAL